MSSTVILESALNMRRALLRDGGEEVAVVRDGIRWRYRDGEGLVVSRDGETVELPESALDDLRWAVVET